MVEGLFSLLFYCEGGINQYAGQKTLTDDFHCTILETVVSCGDLEGTNNSYIEQIVEPCVSKNQEGILAMWI